jgi:hypothetical protein
MLRAKLTVFACILVLSAAKLEMVFILNRHAARAPLNYVITPGLFKEKRGELTEAGIKQSYEIGSFLRDRYMDGYRFLSRTYKPEELYVKVSNVQRCYVTAISALYGLYGPSTGHILNELSHHRQRRKHSALYDLIGYPPFYSQNPDVTLIESNLHKKSFTFPAGFPPIQVQMANEKRKDLFFHAHAPAACPYIKQVTKRIKASKAVRKQSRKYVDSVGNELVSILNQYNELIHKQKGELNVDDLSIHQIKRIYDCYKVYAFHKKPLPPFSKRLLKKLHDIQFYFVYVLKYGDDFIKRATVTKFMNEINSFIVRRIKDREKVPKFYYYVAHDSNVQALLSILYTRSLHSPSSQL